MCPGPSNNDPVWWDDALASCLDPDDDDDGSDNPGDVNPPPPLAMNDNVFHSLGVTAMNWRME